MALRIGLTGGIGSGKSTVATAFARRGAAVVDTDAIARSLTAPGGAAIDALRAAFGRDCIDAHGGLDRAWMRQRAFTTPAVRRRLEALLHPLIGQHAESQAQAAADRPCIVFDVPLLVESAHWRDRVDRIVVVDAPRATQVDRVMQRSGWTRDEVDRVIARQASRAARRAAADAVIDNPRHAPEAPDATVEQLWRHWVTAA